MLPSQTVQTHAAALQVPRPSQSPSPELEDADLSDASSTFSDLTVDWDYDSDASEHDVTDEAWDAANVASGQADAAALGADVAKLNSRLLGLYDVTHQASAVTLHLPIDELQSAARQVLGLQSTTPILVTLDFGKGYGPQAPLPLIRVAQKLEAGTYLQTDSERSNATFTAGVFLVNVLTKRLQQFWRDRPDDLLIDLCRLAADRLLNYGDHCLMCDDMLPASGLLPTVCDTNALCAFQFDNLGLGNGTAMLHDAPMVSELLLTFAVAAGRSNRSAWAMPRLPDGEGPTGAAMTAADVATILGHMPQLLRPLTRDAQGAPKSRLPAAADAMQAVPYETQLPSSASERRALLNAAHPQGEAITRWTLSTNRAQLRALQPNECFATMNTPFQFRIDSATRAHEKAFAAMKAKHGSFFAFHGSPLGNWHNILRQNLVNASHTPMMSTGAVYGSGIYLAADSGTSASYASYASYTASGMGRSFLGNAPTVIAICEVANAPSISTHSSSGIYVSPDPTCVTLRYLLVYNGRAAIPHVAARTLRPVAYCNALCFINQTPVADIEPADLFVTKDDYAWDITLLIQYIEITKMGLFINGWTDKPLAPEDVTTVLAHPEAQNLRRMVAEQKTLGKHIAKKTYEALRHAGRILQNDNSEDFAPSQTALAALNAYIATLGVKERDALDRLPFDCTDSHTKLPIRDTVGHQLSLVASGGECIHRLGDFLQQIDSH